MPEHVKEAIFVALPSQERAQMTLLCRRLRHATRRALCESASVQGRQAVALLRQLDRDPTCGICLRFLTLSLSPRQTLSLHEAGMPLSFYLPSLLGHCSKLASLVLSIPPSDLLDLDPAPIASRLNELAAFRLLIERARWGAADLARDPNDYGAAILSLVAHCRRACALTLKAHPCLSGSTISLPLSFPHLQALDLYDVGPAISTSVYRGILSNASPLLGLTMTPSTLPSAELRDDRGPLTGRVRDACVFGPFPLDLAAWTTLRSVRFQVYAPPSWAMLDRAAPTP